MGTFYNNPRELTPNQVMYADDYCKKSKDFPKEFNELPDFHCVYEWEDGGFVDYTIYDTSGFNYKGEYIKDKAFYVWSFFSTKDTDSKFKKIVDMAKNQYNCDVIRFSTLRNQDAWIKNLKKSGINIVPEQTIFKYELRS